ncbi:TetR/AcrR family transcriptional regulator [Trueperella sp. LYQ143]|uniref:TetR/AcrR family transcriptional regulator n=1 Tax=Trueperella sp. LYQ143 TaxID=3391059 RepID=UPI0039831607
MGKIAEARAKRLATPPTARRQDTAEKLRETAAQIIAEEGMAQISVQRICRRAGFTRGAFYSSYRDLDHILQAIVDNRLTQLENILSRAEQEVVFHSPPHNQDEAEARLMEAAERISCALPLTRDFYLLQEELNLYGARHEIIGKLMSSYEERLAQHIAQVVDHSLMDSGYRLNMPSHMLGHYVLAFAERLYRRLLLQHHHDQSVTRASIAVAVRGSIPMFLKMISVYDGPVAPAVEKSV